MIAVLVGGGGSSRRYSLIFETAGQLVKGDEVQVGGRRIGTVKAIDLTQDNQAKVDVEVSAPFAPLHQGTTAAIRMVSLAGVANRTVVLSPGPNSSPALPDGATIQGDRTTTPVDVDQLFDTFDAKTRRSLRQVIQGTATQLDGQGANANQAARYFDPALSTTRSVVDQLDADQQALDAFLRQGGRATQALAARGADITDLVSNANRAAEAIGADRAALDQDLRRFPAVMRRANSTFVNLRATLDDLDTLVDASKPATRDLARYMRQLRPLLQDAGPTIDDLAKLVRRSGGGNDLTDLLNRAPRLAGVAGPALRHDAQAFTDSIPDLSFIRPYTPELANFARYLGQATANYDANGHYARVGPMFTPFMAIGDPQTPLLVPRNPNDPAGNNVVGQVARCPGAAAQPPADGSAPWRGDDGTLDCDPSIHP